MIGYAEAHLALSGAATSVFIGAAGLGGLVMPWTLGQLFDAHGPEVLPPVILVGVPGDDRRRPVGSSHGAGQPGLSDRR